MGHLSNSQDGLGILPDDLLKVAQFRCHGPSMGGTEIAGYCNEGGRLTQPDRTENIVSLLLGPFVMFEMVHDIEDRQVGFDHQVH